MNRVKRVSELPAHSVMMKTIRGLTVFSICNPGKSGSEDDCRTGDLKPKKITQEYYGQMDDNAEMPYTKRIN